MVVSHNKQSGQQVWSEWKEIKDEFLFEATTIFSLEDMSTLAISASEAGLESLILSRLNSNRFGPSPG